MGDTRLSARLVKSAGLLAAYPGHKINASPDSDSTAINAFYRLIEKPAESAVSVENILAPHRERDWTSCEFNRANLAHTHLASRDDLLSGEWNSYTRQIHRGMLTDGIGTTQKANAHNS